MPGEQQPQQAKFDQQRKCDAGCRAVRLRQNTSSLFLQHCQALCQSQPVARHLAAKAQGAGVFPIFGALYTTSVTSAYAVQVEVVADCASLIT